MYVVIINNFALRISVLTETIIGAGFFKRRILDITKNGMYYRPGKYEPGMKGKYLEGRKFGQLEKYTKFSEETGERHKKPVR
jgi:hypothetical protein